MLLLGASAVATQLLLRINAAPLYGPALLCMKLPCIRDGCLVSNDASAVDRYGLDRGTCLHERFPKGVALSLRMVTCFPYLPLLKSSIYIS